MSLVLFPAVALALMAVQYVSVLPLHVGASYQQGADRFTIDAVRISSGLTLNLRRSGATTIFDRRQASHYECYFRNPRAGDAVAANAYPTVGEASMFFSGLNFEAMFGFRRRPVSRMPSQHVQDAMKIDQAWLGDAELVIVRIRSARRY